MREARGPISGMIGMPSGGPKTPFASKAEAGLPQATRLMENLRVILDAISAHGPIITLADVVGDDVQILADRV